MAWALAGQAPGAAASPDIPISHRDRVYAAEQFSNTVSVTDPVDNKLLGVIRLGDPQPGNFSPLYKGQVLVHGMGYLARPQDACDRLDRIEFGDVHRHRDERDQARHLCRPFAARGVLHAERKGSLGHRARRELYQRHRRREFCREEAHRGAGRSRHADLLARRQIRLHLLVLQSGNRRGVSRRPRHRGAREAGKPVLPEHRRHA